jgi:1-acyl-sn-glycerol-3-phosphate acyltransferase
MATLVVGPTVIVAGLLRLGGPRFYDQAGRIWSGWIVWATGCPVRVEGLEHLQVDGPLILAGNHQSWFDVPAVAFRIPKTFHFVAKKELEDVPIFGRAWKAAGHISIDRSNRESAVRSLERAGQQLRAEGSAVIIFPEGTRAPTDKLLRFKKGAFMLALHTGVPVVPFGVAGTRRVLPKGRWRMQRSPVVVRFGPPIPTADLDDTDREGLLRRVKSEVRRLRDLGRAELGPGELEVVQEQQATAPDTVPGPDA